MKKLGTLLQEAGVIDEIELVRALSHHRKWKCRLGQSLVDLGFVDEETIARNIAGQLELPYVELDPAATPRELLELLPEKLAEEKIFFPVGYSHSGSNKTLIVAFSDPTDSALADALANQAGVKIEPAVARDSLIEEAVRNWSKYLSQNAPSSPEEQLARAHRGEAEQAGGESETGDEAEVVDLNEPAEEHETSGQAAAQEAAPLPEAPSKEVGSEEELLSVSDLPPIDGEESGGEEMEVEHTAAWEQVMPDVAEQSMPSVPEESEMPVAPAHEQIDESMQQDLPSVDESAVAGAPEEVKPSPAETFSAPQAPTGDKGSDAEATKPPSVPPAREKQTTEASSETGAEEKPATATGQESSGTAGKAGGDSGDEIATGERILKEIKSLREEIVQLTMLVESLVSKEEKK